jgi:GNAT superfamily N-acetyltransferase
MTPTDEMKPARFVIEPLSTADTNRYNEYFSKGTIAHPTTLRIDAADIAKTPFSTTLTTENQTVVARMGDVWLGVGSLEREVTRVKRRHIVWVVRMLVTESNQGVGRALLRELKRRAALMPGVTKVNLTVAAHNQAAVHLYESEGFTIFSRELDAFRFDGTTIDELSMSFAAQAF